MEIDLWTGNYKARSTKRNSCTGYSPYNTWHMTELSGNCGWYFDVESGTGWGNGEEDDLCLCNADGDFASPSLPFLLHLLHLSTVLKLGPPNERDVPPVDCVLL
jgi:hypothetical protein